MCEYNTEQDELLQLSNIMEKMARHECEFNNLVYSVWAISDELTGCIVNGREKVCRLSEYKFFSCLIRK